jgi:hypothetical protein
MDRPRSYVVRVYRIAHAGPSEFIGTVHVVDSGECHGFRESAELLAILFSPSTPDGVSLPVAGHPRTVVPFRGNRQGEDEP